MRSKVNPSLYTSPPAPPPRRKEKMSSLKKFKPPRSGKMINICSVKNVIVFPQKYCWGGGGGHVCASKERAHPHGENGPHVEIENRPDRKKCTHKGKSHPHGFFYSPPPPGRAPTLAPSFPRASAYSCPLP